MKDLRLLSLWTCLLASLACASACASVDDPYTPFPVPDFSAFVTKVQPVLASHCASPACHGEKDRSLSLYAVDYLRAPPAFSDTPLDEKYLTDAELAWNYDALRIRIRGEKSASSSKLLLKCLDPKKGGIRHATGIVIFPDIEEPEYKVLRDWISGGIK